MRVLVTRSGKDAEALAELLGEQGFEPLLDPQLQIKYLEGADLDVTDVQALLATSANGVRAIEQSTPRRDIPVLAVGDQSAAAAREAGFAEVESASGDVDALAQLCIRRLDAKAGALLHPAGSEVAGDLGGVLTAAGFDYRRQVVYEATPPKSLSPATVAAIKDGNLDAVLFYSPRTAETFADLARKARIIRGCREITAFCLSPNVAQAASAVAWRDVRTAARPTQESLLGLLAQFAGPARDVETATSDPAMPHAAVPADAPIRSVPPPRRRQGAFGTVVTTLIVLAILVGGALASRSVWTPYLAARFPDLFGPEKKKEDPLLADLAGRMAELEKGLDLRNAPDLQRLRSERDQLKSELKATLERLASLEEALGKVRHMVDALSADPGTEEARDMLRRLAERVGELEKTVSGPGKGSGAELARLAGQVAALEKTVSGPDKESSAEFARLAGQVEALERKLLVRPSETGGRAARALLLAVGQLRDGVRGARPFADELSAVRAVASGDSEITAILTHLEPRASLGVQALGTLRARFDELASRIVLAERESRAEGWIGRTLANLYASVKWRRTDDFEGDGVEAVVARTERALATGHLSKAIRELAGLRGAPAGSAENWLADARALAAAEKALAGLQVRAISRLAAVDGK